MPQPGSPAIDRAPLAACPPIDQRGFIRPIDGWQSAAAPLLDQGAAVRNEEPRLLSGPNGAASLVFRRFDAANATASVD
ncbi:MAG: choice-of-anchor Q domain-containing protein [Caldilinea sp.]